MRKIFKPERVAGIVALSYLVLIPGAIYLINKKVWVIEEELNDLWRNLQGDPRVDAKQDGVSNG